MSKALPSIVARLRPFMLGAGVLTALSGPALAGSLPAPYVSRALEAVLIPIDGAVKSAFGLTAEEKGILVLAVAPGGVAETAGIEPGDVIGLVSGKVLVDPITLDEIVYYWIEKGTFDFGFVGWHGGTAKTYPATITLESYSAVIDVTTVSTWASYAYESFSYAEYTAEYSSEISESYAASETTIEETTSSEEFVAEETALERSTTEETTTEDATTEDATATDGMEQDATDPNLDTDGDGTPDVTDTDDDNDGIPDATDADENGDGTADAEE